MQLLTCVLKDDSYLVNEFCKYDQVNVGFKW